jgi:hypothetical protein
MRLTALVLAACLALPTTAVSEPLGIAFVEAPEQGSGVALAALPEEAFELATQACMETGALAEDCLAVAWCFPAGWSVDLFQQHREGPHWHVFHCGLPDRETALAVAATICKAGLDSHLIECAPVRLFDPEGTQIDIDF